MNAISYHWRVARDVLAQERQRTIGKLCSVEPDFLPAALEVIERPVSPTGRLTAWILLVGLLLTICWLTFGRVDIVASAQGQIMPSDDVKLVQAANSGIVRHIYAHDGDVVRRGQPLIDLDPTVSTAEEAEAAKGLLAAQLDVARDQAIADALSGKGLHFSPPIGTTAEVVATQHRLIAAQVAESDAAVGGLAAARISSLADARAAREQIRTYSETVPVLDREVDAMNVLAAKGYAPGLKILELQRQRRSEAGERDVAVAQQARAVSDARKFGEQLSQSREQARQSALADLAKAQNEAILRREELTKAREKSRLQRLVAPVDGAVQQLAQHTVGGVVEPVKALMVIVPEGALMVQAKLLNKDAGFVRIGQIAAVKLKAFPFTKYGSISGRIVSISRDAVQDSKSEPYFVARISLKQTSISTENGIVQLSPGLETTSDINIGSRRIFEYLISPLNEARLNAGREK